MIHIDNTSYSDKDLSVALEKVARLADKNRWQKKRLAVCTRDIFSWLALLLYCRENQISLAPLHPDTPQHTARERALKFDCDILLWQSLEEEIKIPKKECQTVPHAALIQSSSGTTGDPKIIERSWESIEAEIKAYNRSVLTTFDMTPVLACPVTHAYGMICGFLATYDRKQDLHIVSGLNPRFVLTTMHKYSQPLLYSSPPFIQNLINLLEPSQRLFAVMSSGTAIAAHQIEHFRTKVHHLFQQYGCSEAGCLSMAYQPEKGSCLGRALSSWKITAGATENKPEEIIARQETTQIHTQDAGYFDHQENLHFVSRQDDTIVVSGYNVYPSEVEEILLRHPKIQDAVVFKLPLNGSEKVAALYCAHAPLTNRDLRSWCNQFLPAHQWPSVAEQCESLPRMANGKINRRNLVEKLNNGAPPSIKNAKNNPSEQTQFARENH